MAGFEDSFYGQFLRHNPYPEGSEGHARFLVTASLLAEKHSRIAAAVHERLQVAKTEDDYLQLRLYAVGEMFSLQALIVAYSTTFANLAQSLQAIEDLYGWFLAQGTTNSSGSDVRLLRQELAIELTRRKFHWLAECHKKCRDRLVVGDAAVEPTPATEPQNPAKEQPPDSANAARSTARRAFVEPLLAAKGWSRTRWAQIANVDRSVVFGYLDGESSPHPESRASLAGALQIDTAKLPD